MDVHHLASPALCGVAEWYLPNNSLFCSRNPITCSLLAAAHNFQHLKRQICPAIHTRKGTAIWFRPAIFRSLLGLKPFNRQCRSQNGTEYGKHGYDRPRDETYVFDIDAFMAAAVRKAADQHHRCRQKRGGDPKMVLPGKFFNPIHPRPRSLVLASDKGGRDCATVRMNWDLLSDLSDCTHIQIHKRKIR